MLHTNDDFLSAIRANPHERTLRLVYADWLDEHDAPDRAELVRVEEEMRQVPVFADRFWELKPRRNALRASAGAEWCERMRYGTECEPVFRHGIPDGWRERWRLIREFTERWHRVPTPDIGGRQKEIAEAEVRLGRALPASVREWIAFAHDLNPPDAEWLCVLRDPYQMEEVPGHAALSLLLQAEGDYHWAVQHKDLSSLDPPVYGYHWDHENRDESTFVLDKRNPAATALTDFVLGYAMGYAHGEGGGFNVDVDVHGLSQLRRELETAFPPPTRFGTQEIHELDNVMVITAPPWWDKTGVHVRVEVAALRPGQQVPAFLANYARGGGSFHGMFTPANHRHDGTAPPAPYLPGPDDPIPF